MTVLLKQTYLCKHEIANNPSDESQIRSGLLQLCRSKSYLHKSAISVQMALCLIKGEW